MDCRPWDFMSPIAVRVIIRRQNFRLPLMNMNYLQDEFSNLDTFPPLSTSKVSRELHSRGYTFIRFESYSASHFDF